MSIDHTAETQVDPRSHGDRFLELYFEVEDRWGGHWYAITEGDELFHDPDPWRLRDMLKDRGIDTQRTFISCMPERRPFWVL